MVYIYHKKHQLNVGKYTSPMDPFGGPMVRQETHLTMWFQLQLSLHLSGWPGAKPISMTDPMGMVWVLTQIGVLKTPQIIHFNRGFHYKPSILGVFPLFLETHG